MTDFEKMKALLTEMGCPFTAQEGRVETREEHTLIEHTKSRMSWKVTAVQKKLPLEISIDTVKILFKEDGRLDGFGIDYDNHHCY